MTPAERFAILRRFVDAFNRRDFDALVDDLDPAVELHEWPAAPGAGSYRGPAAAREAVASWFEVWEWMHVETEELVEIGDRVVVTMHQRAKGKGSEVEVEIRSFNVYTFRDSRVVRIELFTEEDAALRAAGVDAANARSDAERLRQVNDAVAAGDAAAIAELVHPDVVWEHNIGVGSPEEGIYRGRESLIALFGRILEPWEQLRPVPREIRQLGEGRYAVEGQLQSKHRASQSEIVTPYEQTLELRDGLLVKGRMKTGSAIAASRETAA